MSTTNSMYSFSERSKEKLITLDNKLVYLMNRAITIVDFSILCGYRTIKEQKMLLETGRTKTLGSLHCLSPACAVDIAPYPIDWRDEKRFYYLAGVLKALAEEASIPLIWGGDWDNDGKFKDNRFDDLGHFELG